MVRKMTETTSNTIDRIKSEAYAAAPPLIAYYVKESTDKSLCTEAQTKDRFYPVECPCGWKGCSCDLEGGPIADTGDSAYYCPECNAEL